MNNYYLFKKLSIMILECIIILIAIYITNPNGINYSMYILLYLIIYIGSILITILHYANINIDNNLIYKFNIMVYLKMICIIAIITGISALLLNIYTNVLVVCIILPILYVLLGRILGYLITKLFIFKI